MLKNKKIYVGKHSKEIQEKAFKLGWYWVLGKKIINTDKSFLFFENNKRITYTDNLDCFNNSYFQEITWDEMKEMKDKGSSLCNVEFNEPIYNFSYEIISSYTDEEEAKKELKKKEALIRIYDYMRKNNLFYDDVDWGNIDKLKYQIMGWSYYKNKPDIGGSYGVNASKGNLFFRTLNDKEQVLENCKEDLEIYLK